MLAVIQRVTEASVTVDNKITGEIEKGLFVLVGVENGDSEFDADILAKKTAALRIFEDENEKLNLSVTDVGGKVLSVSQFTLCADTKKGNRPSFTGAMEPVSANELYELYSNKLLEYGMSAVEKGVFRADMLCKIYNDGPVTIILDTKTWRK